MKEKREHDRNEREFRIERYSRRSSKDKNRNTMKERREKEGNERKHEKKNEMKERRD